MLLTTPTIGGFVDEAEGEPVLPLSESKAKFVVMSNVLGGIRDYDCGGWRAPDAPSPTGRPELQSDLRLAQAWQRAVA